MHPLPTLAIAQSIAADRRRDADNERLVRRSRESSADRPALDRHEAGHRLAFAAMIARLIGHRAAVR
jgi:hypothetical protein